jgi:hypothetical protein
VVFSICSTYTIKPHSLWLSGAGLESLLLLWSLPHKAAAV